jgi:radical SAM superfamily enzyme YgiQ (UPF0313 family)
MVCEPLELEYVAALLHDHEVQILDLILEKNFEKRLREFSPHIVGTSSYITGVNEVKKLCRLTKRWDMSCTTVVGGVHAAKSPEDFADPAIDCIALGDGTVTMPAIVAAVESRGSISDVPGLAIPVGERTVARTRTIEYMPHPDSLPFPRRDLVEHLKDQYFYLFHQPVATMKTTWGCWYKCNFCCTWEITDGIAYSRSAESIVEELKQIEAEDVYIVDDIFLIKPSRLNKIAELIRANNIEKKFLVYGRADFIAQNEEIIAEWSELGLSAVLIGLEAATDRELDSMNKETTVDMNGRAIKVLRRNGVDVYGSLIPDPSYSHEDWESLFEFIIDNDLYYLNISPLTPLPGTAVFEKFESSLTVPRNAHGLWDLSHVVLPTKMPLKKYYRALLNTYQRACLSLKRADQLSLRTRPPVFSIRYLTFWLGAFRIWLQLRTAHRHHRPREIAKACHSGPDVPGLSWKKIESTKCETLK